MSPALLLYLLPAFGYNRPHCRSSSDGSAFTMMTIPLVIDLAYLQQTARELVRIDSTNPSLGRGGRGEAGIAAYIAGQFSAMGLEASQHEPEPGRVSVVGRLPGRGGGRSLMWNAHVDTVGVEDMPDPFSGRIENGRLYGRGAYDMKGSVAAQLAAARALVAAGVHLTGDLLVACVADEEYASIGTAGLLQHYRPHGAIVTEPTALQLCRAHKGFVWLRVTATGRAAHGSRPELGIDANIHMGRILGELEQLARRLQSQPAHPLVGPPSLHAATLAGGTEWSAYAARSILGIERRTIPGETAAQVKREVQEILDRLAAADPDFQAAMETVLIREPFEVSATAPIVRAVEASAAEVLGAPPRHMGDSPWMDAALLAAAGVEAVVIGPTGGGAHAAEEWVELDSLAALAAILARTAIAYCGTADSAAGDAG
jgi:acetylornithine deacetylase